MKKILFALIFIVSATVQSQNHLGVWSFEKVDRDAIDTGAMEEEELEERIKMVSNMFSSMKLDFIDASTYEMSFMSQKETHEYTKEGSVITLADGGTLEILSDDQAKMSNGRMSLFLQKGDVTVEKSYTYLTAADYENSKINSKDLLGKWKVAEVRIPANTEGAELQEMVGLMITFNFITDKDMSFGAMGMETVTTYRLDKTSNELVTQDAATDSEKRIYVIKELDKEHMIVYHNKEGMLLYMVKE